MESEAEDGSGSGGQPLVRVEYQAPQLAGLDLHDQDRVAHYLERASADATLRAYRADWEQFAAWCIERGHRALPASPAVAAGFLSHLADLSQAKSTIGRKLAAIVFAHRAADLVPPTQAAGSPLLERTLRGIRKSGRTRAVDKKRPADGDVLRDLLRTIEGESLRAIRDRALLGIGMAGAFRRSEIVGIDIGHVREVALGLEIRIPYAKTDQEGRGATVVIPDGRRIAPVALYKAWIARAGIADGPVFRKLSPKGTLTPKRMSDKGVALVVKACAAAAGYDPALFAGHSLRAGFLTEAAAQGANLFKMKEHSRHKSLETVSEYVRDQERFRDHAGEGFL